ncbi:MAG: hypothetical protein F6K30_30760, partial [Cyanothece sp. SIO2G6]|nr:hypothetical protein [Cyanothece sp. SIO2G6]
MVRPLSHPHPKATTSAKWTPALNRLPSRPFDTADQQQTNTEPKAFQTRPFDNLWIQPNAVPEVQTRQEQRRFSELFDLTKVDLFAGARSPESPAPTTLHRRTGVSSLASEVDEESDVNEKQEKSDNNLIQRKCATCAAVEKDNEKAIQAKLTTETTEMLADPGQDSDRDQSNGVGSGDANDKVDQASTNDLGDAITPQNGPRNGQNGPENVAQEEVPETASSDAQSVDIASDGTGPSVEETGTRVEAANRTDTSPTAQAVEVNDPNTAIELPAEASSKETQSASPEFSEPDGTQGELTQAIPEMQGLQTVAEEVPKTEEDIGAEPEQQDSSRLGV